MSTLDREFLALIAHAHEAEQAIGRQILLVVGDDVDFATREMRGVRELVGWSGHCPGLEESPEEPAFSGCANWSPYTDFGMCRGQWFWRADVSGFGDQGPQSQFLDRLYEHLMYRRRGSIVGMTIAAEPIESLRHGQQLLAQGWHFPLVFAVRVPESSGGHWQHLPFE